MSEALRFHFALEKLMQRAREGVSARGSERGQIRFNHNPGSNRHLEMLNRAWKVWGPEAILDILGGLLSSSLTPILAAQS